MYSLRGKLCTTVFVKNPGATHPLLQRQRLITQVQEPLDTFTPNTDPLNLEALISPSRVGFEGKVVAMQIHFRANNDHRNVRFCMEAAGIIWVVMLALLAPATAQNIPQNGPAGVPAAGSGPNQWPSFSRKL